MFRFIRALMLLALFTFTQISFAGGSYQKPGAPISLAKSSYILTNNEEPQTAVVELNTYATGNLQLGFSGSNGLQILETPLTQLETNKAKQSYAIPVTVTTPTNSKSYLNIFVTFTDDNGGVSTRAISAIFTSGEPPQAKLSASTAKVISMQATETINVNE